MIVSEKKKQGLVRERKKVKREKRNWKKKTLLADISNDTETIWNWN
jgi:hypothetical protein